MSLHPDHIAYRIQLSPHEWTWTQEDQEQMARSIVELDSQISEVKGERDRYAEERRELEEYLWPNQTGLPNSYRNCLIAVKTRDELATRQRDELKASLEKDKADALAESEQYLSELAILKLGKEQAMARVAELEGASNFWSKETQEYYGRLEAEYGRVLFRLNVKRGPNNEAEKAAFALISDRDSLRNQLTHIGYAIYPYIDGAPDAGPTAALANAVACIIEHPERYSMASGKRGAGEGER